VCVVVVCVCGGIGGGVCGGNGNGGGVCMCIRTSARGPARS
jgi:hypothetical protein